jgi:hypothetical protein
MKKIIKTGIEIGIIAGVAKMTYSAIITANVALAKLIERKITKFANEFEAASDIYKAKHPEMFNEEDTEEDEDADE